MNDKIQKKFKEYWDSNKRKNSIVQCAAVLAGIIFNNGYQSALDDPWISVEDGLPGIGEEVLLFLSVKTITQGYLDCDDDCSWWEIMITDEGRDLTFVTHWMPKPSSPEGK